MPIHLIPEDKANHQAYGARIAAVVACAWLMGYGAAQPFMGLPKHLAAALLLAALWAGLAALAAGRLKEWLDARANRAAAEAGLPPPHTVEARDVVHTLYGGISVALPLLVAALLAFGV